VKVLLSGGTGFLGRNFVERLATAGHCCTVLVRRDPANYPQRSGVRFVGYDELPTLGRMDAVVNLAGEWVVGRWSPAKKRRIMDSRIETTRRLVDWMSEQSLRPRVFLSASAVGIYGNRPGEELSEASELDPERKFRYRVCRAWESEALRASELGVRTVCLRIGNVLDGRGGFLGMMLPWLRWLPFFMEFAPRTVTPWIGLPDALRMLDFALTDPRIEGPLNVVGPNPASVSEIVRVLGREFRRPALGRIPDGMVRAFFGEFACSFLDTQDVRPAKALANGFTFESPDLAPFLSECVSLSRGSRR
jgi:uncharacterized protein (TIGR01777 family)